MKKWLVMMTAALILSACGAPSKGEIIEDIKQQAEHKAGYKVKATLHVQADKQKQQYHVFVWNDRHTGCHF